MKKLLYIPILLLVMTHIALGQSNLRVVWADTVLEVSSERKLSNHFRQLHPDAYTAEMALGKPNIMPGNEGTGKVWVPEANEGREFIKLGYKNPIKVRQIAIAEVFNPTAISKIWLYTTSGREIPLDFFNPRPVPLPGRMLSIFIDPTTESINAIKIELDDTAVPGYSGIDAVALSSSNDPIEIFAKIAEGIHTALDPEKMDTTINSEFKDIKPLLSPDGNTMFFSRINHPKNVGGSEDLEDIWIARRNTETGEWFTAENAGAPLNNDGPNFIASIAPAGYTYQLLLGNIYLKNGKMADGLSLSTKTEDGFTPPQEVEIQEFENFSEHANYYLGADGKTILLSVQRRDTYGDRDIYVTFLQQDGKWSIPLNLGPKINSGEEESSPFLSNDGKTLFFSSKSHLGYGGLDIFISRRLDDTWTNWSDPENLGTAVNSKQDDMFFYLTESDTKYAYFTRGNGKDADIYRLLLPLFQLPDPVVVLRGRVVNGENDQPVGDARITFREKDGGRVIVNRSYSETGTGRYQAMLPFGKEYELYAGQEGYIALESELIDLSSIYEPDTIEMDIKLKPFQVGQRISLDDVYFEFDKAILKPESNGQLERILDFMRENPTAMIELDGHTCNMGSDDYNQKLSERRAQAVRTWLIENDIKGTRIKSVGFGELKPVVSNDTEEGREKNRRVEFVILEK